MIRTRATRRFRPRWDLLDERCMLFGYTPAQITAAYGLNAISFTSSTGAKVTGDGTGQTIALIEVYHDPNIQTAVDVFDTAYGLPAVKLDIINQEPLDLRPLAGEPFFLEARHDPLELGELLGRKSCGSGGGLRHEKSA